MTEREFQVGDRVCTVGESWAGREGQEGVITGRTTRGNFKVVLDSDIDRDNAWIVTQNFGVRPVESANVAEGVTKVDEPVTDAINPAHYQGFSNGAQVVDITEHLSFNRGSAIKYLARAGKKDPAKHVEDLEKSLWFIQREIQRVKAGS